MIDALAFEPLPPPPPPQTHTHTHIHTHTHTHTHTEDAVNSFDELFVVIRNQYDRDADEFRGCLNWSF